MVISNIKNRLNLVDISYKEKIANLDFVQKTGSQMGLVIDDRYCTTGDGYEACLYIYDYPNEIAGCWITQLTGYENTVFCMDIHSPDKSVIISNIDKAMEEHSSRIGGAKTNREVIDAQDRYFESEQMYKQVQSNNETMKRIISRLYVFRKTKEEFEEVISKIITELNASGYKLAIAVGEVASDYRALFLPYKNQGGFHQKVGMDILATQIAYGNPFNASQLIDDYGTLYGESFVNNGPVILDLFNITKTRMSYNICTFGKMGAGKSTLNKKIVLDRLSRGDSVRIFDPAGEYRTLTKEAGGAIIDLSGKDNKINALQIRKTDEDMNVTYNIHISILSNIYKSLSKEASEQEIMMFENLIKKMYERLMIIPKGVDDLNEISDITKLENEDYPIWEDFLYMVREYKNSLLNMEDKDLTRDYEYANNIERVISNLVDNYGNIFNHHSSIDNLYDTPLICYDISKLSSMKEEIFDAQIYAALAMCWDNCLDKGIKMKNLYSRKEIAFKDISRFLIIIDESHKWVNASKPLAVKRLLTYMREARKYFGGISLASQSIRDYFPEGSEHSAINDIKTMFELCTYKFIMQQDAASKKRISEIFDSELSGYEIEAIPTLDKGECILSISGDRNINFQLSLTAEEERLYEGSA